MARVDPKAPKAAVFRDDPSKGDLEGLRLEADRNRLPEHFLPLTNWAAPSRVTMQMEGPISATTNEKFV